MFWRRFDIPFPQHPIRHIYHHKYFLIEGQGADAKNRPERGALETTDSGPPIYFSSHLDARGEKLFHCARVKVKIWGRKTQNNTPEILRKRRKQNTCQGEWKNFILLTQISLHQLPELSIKKIGVSSSHWSKYRWHKFHKLYNNLWNLCQENGKFGIRRLLDTKHVCLTRVSSSSHWKEEKRYNDTCHETFLTRVCWHQCEPGFRIALLTFAAFKLNVWFQMCQICRYAP